MKNQLCFSMIAMIGAILFWTSPISAQRITAQVQVNTEKLLAESKEKLAPLQEQLTRYLNEYDWSDNTGRYTIPMQVDIFIEQATATSFEDRYEARVAVGAQSDFQASDKRWRFAYQQGSQLTHSEQFQSLASFIDFYIYMALGQDLDKKTKLGGDPYYQKAFQIAQLSKFTEFYEVGWKERTAYVEGMQSPAKKPYRELEYFFTQGQNKFRVDDRKSAGQYLRAVVLKLKNLAVDNPATTRFYEVHHLDLARMLSALGFVDQLQALSSIDQTHASTYQQFISQTGGP